MIYFGVVEDRVSDELKLGRCRVRISGIHTEDKVQLPTSALPWALVMQPTTSAAMSGIGHSPTGIVEGTWVMVVFRDEFNQHPIIIGTLPGIPTREEPAATASTVAVRSGNGGVWQDSSGTPITTQNQEVAKKRDDAEPAQEIKKPTSLTMSDNGFEHLKNDEGLASLTANSGKKPKIGSNATPDNTTIYSYQDVRGIWTIGWGNTILSNGARVTETTTITKAQADELLLERVRSDYEKTVKRNVKVPLTQSMFDACVSMVYNMGGGNFTKSSFSQSLNVGKYEDAAALIPYTNNLNGVLTKRRNGEKALFLQDGIPQDDGTAKKIPTEEARPVDATQNPVVIRGPEFIPAPTASTQVTQLNEPGFSDPGRIYPRFYNEPDTHRLARNESIDGTIVFKKEAARARGVATASGTSWDQPPIPYNSKYPHNKVYVSESGHVQEFDDTPNNERTHQYHRSGTFTEVDVNGTRVNRIVGDSFEILERNGNILVRGTCNVTIQGDSNILVENDANLEVLGDFTAKVGGNVGFGVTGDFRVLADGEFSVDASRIDLNSGASNSVAKTTGSASGLTEFPPLSTPSRSAEIDSMYETPEEGSNSEFNQQKVEQGVIDPSDTNPVEEVDKKEEADMAEKQVNQPLEAGCDAIMREAEFTGAYKLTQNFTLADVCKGSSGIPRGTNYGLSANTIVCNLKQLTQNCLEPIKKKFPNMVITNTWRSEAVNTRVGGAKTSDHLTGSAADLNFSGFTRKEYYAAVQEIYKLLPDFHQLILEYKNASTWIHVSFRQTGNKRQALTIDAAVNKTLKSGGYVLI